MGDITTLLHKENRQEVEEVLKFLGELQGWEIREVLTFMQGVKFARTMRERTNAINE